MSSKSDLESQWLRSVVLPEIVKNGKFIKNYSEDTADSFKVRDIQISFIGVEEAFMLTTCYRAVIAFEYAGVAEKRCIVVKKSPEVPEEVFDQINFASLFKNEIEAYTIVFPAIAKSNQKEICVPKYHYSDLQRSFATIVLEDFAIHGWRMSKDKVNLSLDHVLLTVKYLANFHGSFFAMKQRDPEFFNLTTNSFQETRFASPEIHPEWKLTQTQASNRIVKVARMYSPEVPEEYLQRLLNLIGNNYRYGKKRVVPVEPMSTLCHGDFLRNNIAYKYEEGSEKPIDVMMFDLQTMRVSSPMIDLTTFLDLSAFKEVRHTHFHEIFNAYCNELSKAYTTQTKTELPEFLSHDSLLKEYIRFLPYSIAITSFFLMALVEPDQMPTAEMLTRVRTLEEITEDVMTRGGEKVDRELAHQVKEMYELSLQYDVDVFEGFEGFEM